MKMSYNVCYAILAIIATMRIGNGKERYIVMCYIRRVKNYFSAGMIYFLSKKNLLWII